MPNARIKGPRNTRVLEKLLAVGILALTLSLVMSERVHRTLAAMIGALLVFLAGLLTAQDILDPDGPVHWEALGLIFGMFVMIHVLQEVGFFKWVGLRILMFARFRALRIFVLFSLTSAVLSAFMDSITVLLFMASLTIEIARILRISPVPFIIAEITSANIGGSATMVGDPPNIIIGTSLGYSFTDFVVNIGPIAVAAFLANLVFFHIYFRRQLGSMTIDSRELAKVYKYLRPPPERAIKDRRTMVAALAILTFSIALIIMHGALGISVAVIGIIGAVLTMLVAGGRFPDMMERIDWKTLLFFFGLFIVVGGLESAGVTADIAGGLASLSGGNVLLAMTILLWFTTLFSALIDDVPLAATMVPVIRNLASSTGMDQGALAWATCVGCDMGGNASPIAASGNVVGLSVLERSGRRVSWREYCRAAVPATVLVILLCNVILVARYLLF
jgi:Na+/H+ antiporter NhaD/arsenite permease-like protein